MKRFLFIMTIALAGCGAHKKSDNQASGDGSTAPAPAPADPASAAAALEGAWETVCDTEIDNPDFPTAKGILSDYTFKAGQAVMVDKVFSDTHCQQPLVNVTFTGSFKVSGPAANVPGAFNLDLTGGSLALALQDNTQSANVKNICSQDRPPLTGTVQCAGEDQYQIFQVDGTHLLFGDNSAAGVGDSPDKRPTALLKQGATKVH